jgi:hypothetical protein
VLDGIFFKCAVESPLYGNDIEAAKKVARHELHSLDVLTRCGPGVRSPLTALIDFWSACPESRRVRITDTAWLQR